MTKTGKKIIFIILAIVIVGITSASFIVMAINNNIYNPEPKIESFEECAKYYEVMESDPMQCRTPDGRNFVEQKEEDENDEVFCTMIYAPVCGVDGVTYGNRCVAEQQENVEVAYEGECGKENAFSEPRICTREYMPVCGLDGVTYGNRCEAGDMGIAYEGECKSSESNEIITCTEEQKKAEFCTLEYAPVCGSDGITHGNKCAACASEGVEYYRIGEC